LIGRAVMSGNKIIERPFRARGGYKFVFTIVSRHKHINLGRVVKSEATNKNTKLRIESGHKWGAKEKSETN
jgi:hypothetical protein